MSSVSEIADDLPILNSDTSKGSSVSSGMQEEYNELLKYAVVIPNLNSQEPCGSQTNSRMPMLNLQEPNDVPLTTVDEYSSSSSSSRSENDGHDSAMGSDEITTDRKTFREPFLDLNKDNSAVTAAKKEQASVTEVDQDVARMNEQLKIWNCKLNNMVMAEFGQAKMTVIENYRKLLHDKELEHQSQINRLTDEIENMKELLHTYESSLSRKDIVISNLTRALQTNKEKQEMLRALGLWKLKLNDERRQAFTTNLARKHREHVLATRTWQSWRALVEGSWKEKVEKACQKKAREVCMQLTDDYEEKISSLTNVLDSCRAEVARLNDEREKYEESMKKAFMRGVCALNLEAMTMFQNEEGAESHVETLSSAVDALSCAPRGDHYPTREPPTHQPATRLHPGAPIKQPTTTFKPTTVFSRPTNNLHVTNPAQHNAEVTAHARTQVPINFVPPHHSQAKCPFVSASKISKGSDSKVTSSRTSCAKTKLPAGVPASILVKRHHPNLQNRQTHKPLKHVAKYPNTPARPIAGQ